MPKTERRGTTKVGVFKQKYGRDGRTGLPDEYRKVDLDVDIDDETVEISADEERVVVRHNNRLLLVSYRADVREDAVRDEISVNVVWDPELEDRRMYPEFIQPWTKRFTGPVPSYGWDLIRSAQEKRDEEKFPDVRVVINCQSFNIFLEEGPAEVIRIK
jgi:hypothetical protein